MDLFNLPSRPINPSDTYTYKRGNDFDDDINEMVLPMSEFEFRLAHKEWSRGVLIQNAFTNLYAEEREFIMTGITPQMWNDMIGLDDDGDWV